MTWEAVIGIEIHVELATRSKMFCGCAVDFGGEPNRNVCPTCLALPGALPVPNRTALEWISRVGMALNCEIVSHSLFHRKNYFYADLPKNYQISQFDLPVCVDGWLDVEADDETVQIGIERVHMEEDTGKSVHMGDGGRIHAATETLIDLNRAGVPLVEIVSRPDMRTAAQARGYAQEIRAVVAELGVSDAKLEEGSMRFDANVSVRLSGDSQLGTKIEVKNMNSFRSLERAVAYEIERQIAVLESGGRLVQATRHWDESGGITQEMRTKEGSSDYRYFAEPDLVPMVFDDAWRSRQSSLIPELPSGRRVRYRALGIDAQVAAILTDADADIRELFDDAIAAGSDPRSAAVWVTGEVTGWLRREGVELPETPLLGRHLAELVGLVEDGTLSASGAKEVLDGVARGEGSPADVARSRDLVQVSDTGLIEAEVDAVLADNSDAVGRYRGGETKIIGFLVGQVMGRTQGKADPRLVNELLRAKLGTAPTEKDR